MSIRVPNSYSEAIELALMARKLCFVCFSGPDNEDLPIESWIHITYIDDCPEGIESYNWEAIDIDTSNPDGYDVGKKIRDLIEKAREDKETIFVLLDMEKSIKNKDISDLLTKQFKPVVEENLRNFILPERIKDALHNMK